jgi:hypothetical protein
MLAGSDFLMIMRMLRMALPLKTDVQKGFLIPQG